MPSFAKANNPSADPLGALDDIWKNKEVDVVADLMKEFRLRAATILRTEIPGKMLALKELIKSVEDESSPFWKGHVHQGDYVRPQMLHHSVATGQNAVAGETGVIDGVISAVADTHINGNGHTNGHANGHSTTVKVKAAPIVLPEDIAAVFPTSSPADLAAASAAAAKGEAGEKDAAGCVNGGSKSPEAVAEKKATVGQHWFEVVPRNKVQGQCIEIALREFEAMYDIVNELKLWLEMEIPVIEDGNSFGTEIQQHLITQLVNANKAIVAWENAVRQHYTDRAKYVAEWVKTPNVEDWALTIASSDRFDHHLIRGYLMRALTVYAGLLTKFERNWEKVLHPKGKQGNASVGMY